MDNRPIGIFDSGLGGLTAVRELEHILPQESLIYFGDTGRVPYGNRSNKTIIQYVEQAISFLKSHDVKALIAACGTASSVAGFVGKKSGLPYVDVLTSSVAAAVATSKSNRIGVIGTTATVASGAYLREISKLAPTAQVFQQPCPLFIPLVENNFIDPDNEVTRLVAKKYLAPLRDAQIDVLILGCTHFPIISPIISSVIGESVKLIDSGRESALALASLMKESELCCDDKNNPDFQFYVTDAPQNFSEIAEIFLGHSINENTNCVNVESFTSS